MDFRLAQRVADAVLWEGYVLYPYRASAVKNRFRWQFGVLTPKARGQRTGEPWAMQTECLVEPESDPTLDLRIRFLQVQARTIEACGGDGEPCRPVERLEVDGRELVTWEEGIERWLDLEAIALDDLLREAREVPLEFGAGCDLETVSDAGGRTRARVVRERWPLSGRVTLRAERIGNLLRLRVVLENLTEWPDGADPARPAALRSSLVGAHTLLGLRGGAFVSLLEPPEWAADAVGSCRNLQTWPVLVGEPGSRATMLSSPIILYDYPTVAPESPGDLFDATEIDEILTLRIMTLAEDEKREARGTDERARQVIDRTDALPAEVLERLHGAIRQLQVVDSEPAGSGDDSDHVS
ncbi:MAG TPA: hypothetical protein VJQ46_13370 [Gemmatimonadales bacterium]|nr:hypothetical protein [Gemmatimonadales bacterium]